MAAAPTHGARPHPRCGSERWLFGPFRVDSEPPTICQCAEGQGFEAADRVRTQLVKLSSVTMSRSAEPGLFELSVACGGPGSQGPGYPSRSCRSGVRYAPEDGTDSSQDGSGSVPAGTRLRVGNFVDEQGALTALPSSWSQLRRASAHGTVSGADPHAGSRLSRRSRRQSRPKTKQVKWATGGVKGGHVFKTRTGSRFWRATKVASLHRLSPTATL